MISRLGILWLIIVQIIASGMGGYLAGRQRTKWTIIHTDEVYFRDTAHGFLAWAVGLVISAAFLASIATSVAGVRDNQDERAFQPRMVRRQRALYRQALHSLTRMTILSLGCFAPIIRFQQLMRMCCNFGGESQQAEETVNQATRPALFKWRQTAPELILCAVRWYLRYSLSLRDVEELLAERGLAADHTTI